jgi:hypothetical protein
MADKPLDLDSHRGMMAQKATDLRRTLAEVENHALELRERQAEIEHHLLSVPAASWAEAGVKARYVLKLYAQGCRPTTRCIETSSPPSSRTLPGSPGWSEEYSLRNFEGVAHMTLLRGRFIGYEYDRMVVLFSMLDGEAEVPCAISTSAMDELEGVARARAGEREPQFMRLRARIEACADSKYQAREFEGVPPGIILRSIDFRNQR